MSRGLKRYYGGGDLHYLTFSCYQRRPLLGSAKRRDLFLRVLEQVRRRYRFVGLGYVVMPEHVHLLLSEPDGQSLSVAMQALKLSFARRVLAEQKRRRNPRQAALFPPGPQHIWQARFYDFNVWTERKRIEKLRYIHRNPVRRGLVESPELWRWSSFRDYAFGEHGRVKVNAWQVLTMKLRAPQAPTSRKPRDVGHPVVETWATRRSPDIVTVSVDTESYFVMLQSACDVMADVIATLGAVKKGQVPSESFHRLNNWARENSSRLRPQYREIASAKMWWFDEINRVRTKLVHRGGHIWIYTERVSFIWSVHPPEKTKTRKTSSGLLTALRTLTSSY